MSREKLGEVISILKPLRYSVCGGNFNIELKEELKVETQKTEKRPIALEIVQGENGYMIVEQYAQPRRRWFALNADQLGKLLVKISKEALPIKKV